MFHAVDKPRHEGWPTPHRRKNSMKRRDFIKVTGMSVAGAATMAAPAIAQSMPEIKWRMPTSWPKSLDTLYGGAEMMAKMVAEATDNKFQIQTFAGGEIVRDCRFWTRYRTAHAKSVIPPRTITSARTRPSPSARRCRSDPTCASTRPGTCLAAAGKFSTNFTRNIRRVAARGQHRMPDGRLVPQGDHQR